VQPTRTSWLHYCNELRTAQLLRKSLPEQRFFWKIVFVAEKKAEYTVPSFRILGQFCGTFIAVEKDNALYIFDQHAAHERLIYEALKKNIGSSQELLAPYILETTSEKQENIESLVTSLRDGHNFQLRGE